MPSWSSGSARAQGQDHATVVRRFVEASRRAEIIGVVNSARTEPEVAQAAADELCEALEAELGFITVTRPDRGLREAIGRTGMSADQAAAVTGDPLWRAALGRVRPEVHRGHDLLGLGARHLVLSPWTADNGRQAVIGVARLYDEPFDAAEVALLESVTVNVGHALERSWLGAERDRHAGRQAALARAAKSLSASLETGEVLERLAREVREGLEAGVVLVHAVGDHDALEVVARAPAVTAAPVGLGPAATALAASAAADGAPVVRQPFDEADTAPGGSGLAAPITVHDRVAGVVLAGFDGSRWIDSEDVDLLCAFAELAAIAWRNASDHAAAKRAATLDSLTGCLNHGAFQERLREEVARCRRTGGSLAVAILDLDDFKGINDVHGHLVGDAVLRRVAAALRGSVRPYDHVARYGGDEFAVLLPQTDEPAARGVVSRAMTALDAITVPGAPSVGAGVGLACWRPGDTAAGLLQRADEALLGAKKPSTGRRAPADEPPSGGRSAERERRRLGRLATAGALGTRIARLLDERLIAETTVLELAGTLGYGSCVLVRCDAGGPAVLARATEDRSGPHGAEVPAVARRCLDERGTVLLVPGPGEAEGDARPWSQLAVPIRAGGEAWGATVVAARHPAVLDDDDAQLLERVSDHVGAALHAAALFEQLEQTHLGTAAALAAALEAKDRYTADHARSIADLAVAVGRDLGMTEEELRDLRYGAVFHDIGKIAVPDAILNKPGALTEDEMAVVREHPVVGEQILAPVPFLTGVRSIVRHDHERWDGRGYPDGLRAEAIPLGARVVLVVDAYHAMRSDRPYRRRLAREAARAELRRHAGTQFDPRVVDALLAVLDAGAATEPV